MVFSSSVRAFLTIGVLALVGCARAAEDAVVIEPPRVDEQPSQTATAVAVLAGGCFWGVQGVYQHVDGVIRAVSGYAGGPQSSASYDAVTRGDTGHAETVQITYDPSKVTYGQLLQVFFSVVHDPTQFNRQGPDHGPQYRSTIFPVNAEQRAIAEQYIAQLDEANVYPRKIVTTIEEGKTFYPAETYHQDFLVRNPTHLYIVINDIPKVEAFEKLFPNLWREEPALVLQASRGGPR